MWGAYQSNSDVKIPKGGQAAPLMQPEVHKPKAAPRSHLLLGTWARGITPQQTNPVDFRHDSQQPRGVALEEAGLNHARMHSRATDSPARSRLN